MSETAATYAVERTWDDIIDQLGQCETRLRQRLTDALERAPDGDDTTWDLADEIAVIVWLRDVAHEQRDLEASYAT